MGLPQQSFGAGLEHGPAALFDSQLGKEIHFLLHHGLGAEAQVGGHLLAAQSQIASSALKSGLYSPGAGAIR